MGKGKILKSKQKFEERISNTTTTAFSAGVCLVFILMLICLPIFAFVMSLDGPDVTQYSELKKTAIVAIWLIAYVGMGIYFGITFAKSMKEIADDEKKYAAEREEMERELFELRKLV